jgi:5-methylcytosine-specific restriction endonuclease McrA
MSSVRYRRLQAARAKATHRESEWWGLVEFVNVCPICDEVLFDANLHKDHIIPISAGGSDGIENIQPLCAACNLAKHTQVGDFRPDGWREFLSERAEYHGRFGP